MRKGRMKTSPISTDREVTIAHILDYQELPRENVGVNIMQIHAVAPLESEGHAVYNSTTEQQGYCK
jgi:hypothetical protein